MMITLYDDAQIMKNHDADLVRSTKERAVKNLMNKLHLTMEEALDTLDIPEEERSRYKELIEAK